MKIQIFFVALLACVSLLGCVQEPSEEPIFVDELTEFGKVETFLVGPEKVDCVGVGPQKCLVVNGDNFYDKISGFTLEEGYEYELRVKVVERDKVPADASRYTYELVEIVSKQTATPRIPQDCISWNDGCNVCVVTDGKLTACTERACFEQGTPFCAKYAIEADIHEPEIPSNCLTWYDGCNNCMVEDGEITACTRRACIQQDTPKCVEYAEEEPVACCMAMTAGCLSCSEGVSVEEYCTQNPTTMGC